MRLIDVRGHQPDETVGYKFDGSDDYVFVKGEYMFFHKGDQSIPLVELRGGEDFITAVKMALENAGR